MRLNDEAYDAFMDNLTRSEQNNMLAYGTPIRPPRVPKVVRKQKKHRISHAIARSIAFVFKWVGETIVLVAIILDWVGKKLRDEWGAK